MFALAVLAIGQSRAIKKEERAFLSSLFHSVFLRLIRGVNSVLTMAICIPAPANSQPELGGNFTPIQSDKK